MSFLLKLAVGSFGELANLIQQFFPDLPLELKRAKKSYIENRYDLRSPVEWLQYLDHNEKSAKTNIISVEEAKKEPDKLKNAPLTTPVGRIDEGKASRMLIVKYKDLVENE